MVRYALIPSQISLLLVVLIPKPQGGERPIRIFPTLLRLVDRWYRWSHGARWLARQHPGPFYGLKGRIVEDAVWRHGLLAEWDQAGGQAAVTLLFDIIKAFEHVRHVPLWEAAKRNGFDLVLMRWIMYTFRMARRFQLYGGCSDECWVRRSIVPGISFADIFMRLSVTDALAQVQQSIPKCIMAVVSDDIQVTVFGKPLQVG